jgi:hypothetical protein
LTIFEDDLESATNLISEFDSDYDLRAEEWRMNAARARQREDRSC